MAFNHIGTFYTPKSLKCTDHQWIPETDMSSYNDECYYVINVIYVFPYGGWNFLLDSSWLGLLCTIQYIFVESHPRYIIMLTSGWIAWWIVGYRHSKLLVLALVLYGGNNTCCVKVQCVCLGQQVSGWLDCWMITCLRPSGTLVSKLYFWGVVRDVLYMWQVVGKGR